MSLVSKTDQGHKVRIRKVLWNLEEEIVKVVEKGVAKRLDKKVKLRKKAADTSRWRMDGGVDDESNSWNTVEEVSKVLEMGAALGFDYNGQEDEVAEYVTLREQEDVEREAL